MFWFNVAFRVFLITCLIWSAWMLCRKDGARELFKDVWENWWRAGSWKL